MSFTKPDLPMWTSFSSGKDFILDEESVVFSTGVMFHPNW